MDSLRTVSPISFISTNHRRLRPLTINYQKQEPFQVPGLEIHVVDTALNWHSAIQSFTLDEAVVNVAVGNIEKHNASATLVATG